MFIPCNGNDKRHWKDYTLIVPSVSVGNVGQLAADLIISTLWLDKAGYLYDDSILPVIGNDPFATGDMTKVCRLMTAAEIFVSDHHKLVVIQLRSSIIPSRRKQFLSKLQAWILSSQFSRVVILTSSFSHERRDSQLEGSQLRYVPSSDFAETNAGKLVSQTLNWLILEKRDSSFKSSNMTNEVDESTESEEERKAREQCSEVYIPGGGFAKLLLQKCIAIHVPAVILLRFCSEGDNILDAIEMATMLNSWLNWLDLKKSSEQIQEHRAGWRIPSSWRLQFGSRFQQMLFQ